MIVAPPLMQGFPRGDAFEIRNDRQAVISALLGMRVCARTPKRRFSNLQRLHKVYSVCWAAAGLANDIKAVNDQIEERLHLLHAAAHAMA